MPRSKAPPKEKKVKLAQCPCGQTPKALLLEMPPKPAKHGRALGNCCASWGIEFFNAYKEGEETVQRASEAWNMAPRA
jgi:hypothetical protein